MVRSIIGALSAVTCACCVGCSDAAAPTSPGPAAQHPVIWTYDVAISYVGSDYTCGIERSCNDSIPATASAVLFVSDTGGPAALSFPATWSAGGPLRSGVWRVTQNTRSALSLLTHSEPTAKDSVAVAVAFGPDNSTSLFGEVQAQGAITGRISTCYACRYAGITPGSFGAHGGFTAAPRTPPFLMVTRKQSWTLPGDSVSEATLFVSSAGIAPSQSEPVSWISRNPNVASVDANGTVHTLAPGTATIVATTKMQNLSDSGVVVVYGATPPLVTISGDSTPMLVNWSRQLTAGVTWAPGVRIRGTTDVIWSSETPNIATVTDSGLVEARSAGIAIIDAASQFMPAAVAKIRLSISLPPAALTFSALTSGGYHSCGVTSSARWYCWGGNAHGELGDGTSTDRPSPRLVTILPAPLVTVVAGGAHTCGLDVAGIAYCWGYDADGELGGGLPVAGNVTFARLSAGSFHTCGIAVDGSVYCWGKNDLQQVSDDTIPYRPTPTIVPGVNAMVIASGADHTCSLTPAGKAYCWGADYASQLGDGGTADAGMHSRGVTAVTSDSTFTALVAGGSQTCGLTRGGAAICWGGPVYGYGALPAPIAGAPPFVALAAAGSAACGLTADGIAYCWGDNGSGQLGDGTTISHSAPWTAAVPVAGGLRFNALAGGFSHVCGLVASGQAYCWGNNGNGQIGMGDTSTVPTKVPVPVIGPQP